VMVAVGAIALIIWAFSSILRRAMSVASRKRFDRLVMYFNGQMSYYIRLQESGEWWSIIVATAAGIKVLPVPSKRWAMLVRKSLIELGHDECIQYLWNEDEADVSSQQAQAAPEAAPANLHDLTHDSLTE
jgi:hypothetical protein